MEDDRENQERGSHGKSGSSGGKLWIKIKISKAEGADGEDRICNQSSDQYPRVCSVCKKVFSSGKALGGHMRVHVQKLKPHDEEPTEDRRKELAARPENNNAQVSELPSCSICRKSFPSMKSLFGHMRCHPEREWRGIQPPPATTKNSSSMSSSVHDGEPRKVEDLISYSDGATARTRVVDLTYQTLPGWLVTGRRGRKGVSGRCETEEDRLRDAVRDLMTLAQGDYSLESELTHNKNRVEAYNEATNSNSMTNRVEIEEKVWVLESKKRRIEEYPVGYTMDCAHKKIKIDETSPVLVKNSDPEKTLLGTGNSPGKSLFIGQNDRKSITDDESDSKNSNGSLASSELIMNYKCESTTRPGPVMMKCRRKRKKLKLTDLESPTAQPLETKAAPVSEGYKCSICSKCFPSHQALGGHKASHNKATRNCASQVTGAPPSEAASPGETSQTGRRILGFDLNELPLMEVEDASSSHNSVA
ncbi:hypothetical protein NMG60_11037472 [Bertholletia excelsa]